MVKLSAEAEIQLDQMLDILKEKFSKRSIDPKVLDSKGNDHIGKLLYRNFSIQQGIDPLIAKRVVKMVKAGKTKVQVSIQGEKIRFTGKKRDQLVPFFPGKPNFFSLNRYLHLCFSCLHHLNNPLGNQRIDPLLNGKVSVKQFSNVIVPF